MLASISVGAAVLVPVSTSAVSDVATGSRKERLRTTGRQSPELLLRILLQLCPFVRKPNCAGPTESRLTSGHAVRFDARGPAIAV